MGTETYKLKKAVARYGAKEYPLHGFPKTLVSDEMVLRNLRSCFPDDSRVGDLRVTELPGVEGWMKPVISFHFRDWAVEVRYEKEV